MRAVLLVKDKEGLNADRLKGRYGLTGKPILTQNGIGASLSSSFKGAQQETLNSLRNISNKLKEAQSALNGTKDNLDNIDKTQDRLDDSLNNLQNALNLNAWEQLWRGIISPMAFYILKFNEDTSYQAMAGEQNFPVANMSTTNYVSAAPIPRLPYWDGVWKFYKLGDYTDVSGFNFSFGKAMNKILDAENLPTKLAEDLRTGADLDEDIFIEMIEVLSSLATLIGLGAALGASNGAISPTVVMSLLILSLVIVAWEIINNSLLSDIIDDILNLKQFAAYNKSIAPNAIYYQNSVFQTLFAQNFDAFNAKTRICKVSLYVSMGVAGAAVTLIGLGVALSKIPFTIVAGVALTLAGIEILGPASLGAASIAYLTVSYYKNILLDIVATRTRKIGEDKENLVLYYGFENPSDDFAWSDTGTFQEYGKSSTLTILQILEILDLIGKSISVVIDLIAGLVLRGGKISNYCNLLSFFTWNNSEVLVEVIQHQIGTAIETKVTNTVYNNRYKLTDFNDHWGVSRPTMEANINDTITGTINRIQYPLNSMKLVDLMMTSRVYDYDYFGSANKIKLFKDKIITNTVVLRGKAKVIIDGKDDLWYGITVLVKFAGDSRLYLLWEREAIYTPDYRHKHAEQMIYNYPPHTNQLPAENVYSYRNGVLEYYYVEDKPSDEDPITIVQFRNILDEKPIPFGNKIINIEYTFGDGCPITGNPMGGFGGLDSYGAKYY